MLVLHHAGDAARRIGRDGNLLSAHLADATGQQTGAEQNHCNRHGNGKTNQVRESTQHSDESGT